MKILIVEDDKDIVTAIKYDLDTNIEVVVAETGVEAYEILYKLKNGPQFDYAIIDIRLPDENGIEIIKLIRQISTTKIIIFTGSIYVDYRNICYYDYYFEKV